MAPDAGLGVLALADGAIRTMLWLPGEVAGLLNVPLHPDGPPPAPPVAPSAA